jgi:RHS repeat-associated protein
LVIPSIDYIYDANGQKLMKRAPGGEETYYAGSFLYKGSNLEYILHAEGKYQISEENGGYQYYLNDHLGNVRMVVKGDETKKILDQTDYYPFGMSMNIALHGSGQKNLYKYNGKELQDDKIGNGQLDWYDYGARMYDPALGRFHTVDPLADFYSGITPYVYAINNPVSYIDVYGLGPLQWWRSLKKGVMRFMGYHQKGSYKAGNVEYEYNPRSNNKRTQGKRSSAEQSSSQSEPAHAGVNGVISPQTVPASGLDISYRPVIGTMPDEKKFPPSSGGGMIETNSYPTGTELSFTGNVFIKESWDLRPNNKDLDDFIVPIVNYLKLHRNVKIELGMSTNVSKLNDDGKENRVKGLDLPPNIVVNRRAYILQQHIKNTYGVPETQLIINPDYNKVGQAGMSVEIKVVK